MNAKTPQFFKFYVRVTDVSIFNALVKSLEEGADASFEAVRDDGYYVIRLHDEIVWKDVYLYGQMLAQAQGEFIEGGQF